MLSRVFLKHNKVMEKGEGKEICGRKRKRTGGLRGLGDGRNKNEYAQMFLFLQKKTIQYIDMTIFLFIMI